MYESAVRLVVYPIIAFRIHILSKNWIFWLFKLSKAASYRLSSHAFLWWDPSIHPPTHPPTPTHSVSQSLVFVFAIIGIICMKQSNVKRIWTFSAYFAHGKRTEEPVVAAIATVAMIACTHAGAGVKNLKPWVPTVPWMGMGGGGLWGLPIVLTANIFESGPMPTSWKFLDGPLLLPSCKLG